MSRESVDHDRHSASSNSGDRARREQILDTAAAVFARTGYAATVMKDVADASGILPGSLYHHFASKEALMVELLTRFRVEAADLGVAALASARADGRAPASVQLTALGRGIAELSVRHRAASHFTRFEPPTNAGREFTGLSGVQPAEIGVAINEILVQGRESGEIAPDVDISVLTESFYVTMQGVGMGLLHESDDPKAAAETLVHLILMGVATEKPRIAELDRSAAMNSAKRIIASWSEPAVEAAGAKLMLIQGAARAEFARRGFEATTVRDIAAAAGVGPGAIYRVIDSKRDLLVSIMESYQDSVSAAYDAVIESDSTSVEKIDALAWVNVNAVETFHDEFKIQSSYLRVVAPAGRNPEWAPQDKRSKQLLEIVRDGVRARQLGAVSIDPAPTNELLARCIRDLMWQAHVVNRFGKDVAMDLCRKTLVRGVVHAR